MFVTHFFLVVQFLVNIKRNNMSITGCTVAVMLLVAVAYCYHPVTLSNEPITLLGAVQSQSNEHVFMRTKNNAKIQRTDGTIAGTTLSDDIRTTPKALVSVWAGAVCAIQNTQIVLFENNKTEAIPVFSEVTALEIARAFYVTANDHHFLFLVGVHVPVAETPTWSLHIFDLKARTLKSILTTTLVLPYIRASSRVFFSFERSAYMYHPVSEELVTVYTEADYYWDVFELVGDSLFYSPGHNNKTNNLLNQYRISTGTSRTVMLAEPMEKFSTVVAAPSKDKPNQVLIELSGNDRLFCDCSDQVVCGDRNRNAHFMSTSVWVQAKNMNFYFAKSEQGPWTLFADTPNMNSTVVASNTIQLPKPIANDGTAFGFYEMLYDPVLSSLFYIVKEIGNVNQKVYQVQVCSYNFTEAAILYPLCVENDGSCDQSSTQLFRMKDGPLVTEFRLVMDNVVVRLDTGGDAPTPRPYPYGSDLTWLIVIGSLIGGVVVIGIAVMIGIAIKSAIDRNKGYDLM
jgi:hypothetical protein